MRPAETIASLDAFPGRGAGTDAERRAAVWLSRALGQARAGHPEPFWCRPNWALAHAWHLTAAVAGSLIARGSPRVGGAIVLVALLSTLADAMTGRSLGRLLTRERASQNVVSEHDDTPPDAVHLVITANYDAGRCGFVYRHKPRRSAARLAKASKRRAPGWIGWTAVALAILIAVAILRLEGNAGIALDLIQLVPTVALLIAASLLLEQATSSVSPAAGDNASGVAAAVALTGALDAAPPSHLIIDVVLQGASDGDGTGLRQYLRARRGMRKAANTVVLGFAPCGAGEPRWWVSDGNLAPVGYFQPLRQMCAEIAAAEPHLYARSYRGRGRTPALPARSARLPAIALGCLDDHGLAPRSHQPEDTPEHIDQAAIDRTVELSLLLVDRIDALLAARGAPAVRGPATARRP
jgi:hypothetical protein